MKILIRLNLFVLIKFNCRKLYLSFSVTGVQRVKMIVDPSTKYSNVGVDTGILVDFIKKCSLCFTFEAISTALFIELAETFELKVLPEGFHSHIPMK